MATRKPVQPKKTAPLKGRPPVKKPGRSIVNQKQTPWGIITITVVLVLFAGGIIAFAVTRNSGKSSTSSNSHVLAELGDAKHIKGIIYHPEPNFTHVTSPVTYDMTPPIGGDHSAYWGDCSGTVYPNAIANENAVHMLEHGGVWITYNKDTIAAGDLAKLTTLVQGRDGMALSPYPDLKTPISLQFWAYQLFVNSASDPRITQFINTLLLNPKATPEYGASCSQPDFKTNPSTFGNPQWTDPGPGTASIAPSAAAPS